MIKVLIVDDSKTVRDLLQVVLESDDELKVIGTVASGEQALALLASSKPDIITMDLHMPGMSGLLVTRKIMSQSPIPIVIVTADSSSALQSFKLIEAGAVAVHETPPAPGSPGHQQAVDRLIKTLKSLSGVKLVKRNYRPAETAEESQSAHSIPFHEGRECKIVVLGASTGGPQTIKQILDELPGEFAFPIVVAQHISSGFLPGFASWLNESSKIRAQIAHEGAELQAGNLYLAPDNMHTGLSSERTIFLSNADKEYGLRPSVSFLFKSAAQLGNKVVAILLTGMGRDGGSELGLIKNAGGLTIAQDKESSIVFGMPAEAIKLGNAQYILPPSQIAQILKNLPGASRKVSCQSKANFS